MTLLIKAVASTAIIMLITWVARRSPGLGGLIASLPIITVLSVLWLSGGPTRIDRFFVGVLVGLVPTAILLAAAALAVRHTGLFPALAVGIALWLPSAFVLQRLFL
jgi:uncharacterized membrane protein (GlpM family)